MHDQAGLGDAEGLRVGELAEVEDGAGFFVARGGGAFARGHVWMWVGLNGAKGQRMGKIKSKVLWPVMSCTSCVEKHGLVNRNIRGTMKVDCKANRIRESDNVGLLPATRRG